MYCYNYSQIIEICCSIIVKRKGLNCNSLFTNFLMQALLSLINTQKAYKLIVENIEEVLLTKKQYYFHDNSIFLRFYRKCNSVSQELLKIRWVEFDEILFYFKDYLDPIVQTKWRLMSIHSNIRKKSMKGHTCFKARCNFSSIFAILK